MLVKTLWATALEETRKLPGSARGRNHTKIAGLLADERCSQAGHVGRTAGPTVAEGGEGATSEVLDWGDREREERLALLREEEKRVFFCVGDGGKRRRTAVSFCHSLISFIFLLFHIFWRITSGRPQLGGSRAVEAAKYSCTYTRVMISNDRYTMTKQTKPFLRFECVPQVKR